MEQRVAALEEQMQGKTLQEHFREQAERFDRAFGYRFEEFEKKMDAKLGALETRLDAKWEQKFEQTFEQKFSPVRVQLTAIEDVVRTILRRLS